MKDKTGWIWTIKKDWYDLDFLYIQKNPGFRSFSIYQEAFGFKNTYMDFFDDDAFNSRRVYITGFYSEMREDLDREYYYLSEEKMEQFVEDCSKAILQNIEEDYMIEIM